MRNFTLTRSAPHSALWRADFLSAYGAVQCVDQRLNLDEFVACSLRLVAVKRSGQHLHMRVSVLDHTLTRFLQRFKSLAHLGSFAAHEGRAPDQAGSASHSAH